MTLDEAVQDYNYDITLYYSDDGKWYWDINGGYCSVGGSEGFLAVEPCKIQLIEFLETFKGFNK